MLDEARLLRRVNQPAEKARAEQADANLCPSAVERPRPGPPALDLVGVAGGLWRGVVGAAAVQGVNAISKQDDHGPRKENKEFHRVTDGREIRQFVEKRIEQKVIAGM